MARLALTIAGGIIGALIAGPGAIALGWSIGALVGGIVGQLAFPGKGTHVYGPRLNDLNVASSAPGTVIPLLFGTMRLGAQIIWSSGIKEVSTTTKQSAGGKGGPSVSSTTYTYFVSFAAAFCQGVATITRIWGDAKLIYDVTGTGQLAKNITVIPTKYTGDETQLPDPHIVSAQGASVTPAYRGTCYCVWSQFPLADFGNRLPNIRAEITANSSPKPITVDAGWPPNTGIFSNIYVTKQISTPDGTTAWSIYDLYSGGSPGINRIVRTDLASNTLVASGLMDYTGIPGFVNFVDFPNGEATCDDLGNIYHCGYQNNIPPSIGGTGSGGVLIYKIDGWTFKAVNQCRVDQAALSAPVAMTAFKLNGVTHLACVSYYSNWSGYSIGGWVLYVVRTTDMKMIGQYPLFPYDIPKFVGTVSTRVIARIVNPSPDESTGTLYVCFQGVQDNGTGNLNQGDSYVWAINVGGAVATIPSPGVPIGTGVFTSRRILQYTAFNALNGTLQGVIFDPSDKTLLGFTDNGQIQKIDPKSGNVLLRTGDVNNPCYQTIPGPVSIPSGTFGYAGGNTGTQFLGMSADFGGASLWSAQSAVVHNGTVLTRSDASEDSGRGMRRWNSSDLSRQTPGTFDNFHNFPNLNSSYTINDQSRWLFQSNSMLVGYVGPLAPSSTLLPHLVRLYVDRVSTSGVTADVVVQTVCANAGIDPTNVDTSLIQGLSVIGYPISALTTGKDLIANLGQALFFEGRETDFKLQFIPRGQPALLTIPEIDLGMEQDKSKLEEGIGQEQDLPKTVEIMYFDQSQDYQQGKQHKIRHHKTTKTVNFTSISLPLVMTPKQASALADRILWTAEAERRTYKTNMWKAYYFLLDPCDVVQFTFDGVLLTGRVVNSTMGQNFGTLLEMNSEVGNNYISVQSGNPDNGFTPQNLPPLASTLLFILDMPYLQDTDVDDAGNLGYYAALAPSGGGTWGAGVLYDSNDGATFTQVDAVTNPVSYGIVQNILGDVRSPYSWDYVNTLTVKMVRGSNPTTDTALNVLNGTNAIILYPSLEVIQFQVATVNGDGSVTVSKLLRGRRGTEWATGAHTLGEFAIFPLASGGMLHEQKALGVLNSLRYYKGVTTGADLSTGNPQAIALVGRDQKPYAPAQLTATRS